MKLTNEIKIYLKETAFDYLEANLDCKQDEILMLDAMHKNISDLGKVWEEILVEHTHDVLDFSMKSYFIHATPMVKYTGIDPSKKSVEFGDVLYIYTETDLNNRVRENAILYQAKKFSKSKVDSDQLKLYLNWPSFWFIKKIMSKVHYNVVTFPQPHSGARYLLLDNSQINPGLFASTMTPIANLTADQSDGFLEEELVGLLDFTTGRKLENDWGAAIKEVKIDNLKNKKNFKGIKRNQPLLYLQSYDNNFLPPEKKEDRISDFKGFWLIHIKSSLNSFDETEGQLN